MCHEDVLRARVCPERLTGAHTAPFGASLPRPKSTQSALKARGAARHRVRPRVAIGANSHGRPTETRQQRPGTTLANTQTSIHAPARLHTDAQPHTDAPLPAPSGRTGRARRRYVSALASRAARARARVPIRTRRPARPAGPEPKRAQLEEAVEVLSSLAARGRHPTRSARPGGSA